MTTRSLKGRKFCPRLLCYVRLDEWRKGRGDKLCSIQQKIEPLYENQQWEPNPFSDAPAFDDLMMEFSSNFLMIFDSSRISSANGFVLLFAQLFFFRGLPLVWLITSQPAIREGKEPGNKKKCCILESSSTREGISAFDRPEAPASQNIPLMMFETLRFLLFFLAPCARKRTLTLSQRLHSSDGVATFSLLFMDN